jgi:tRNA A37 threonylcarbamoyladenosine dehydratase
MNALHGQRFGGIARLYGREGLQRIRAMHVCVVGLGGVGS